MAPALALSLLVVFAAGPKSRESRGDRLQAAQTELSRGNFDGALRNLDAAQAEASDLSLLTRIQLLRAQAYAAKQDYVQAEAALADALEFDPEATLDPAKIDPALVKVLESLKGRLTGELRLTSDPPLKVKVDGVDQGTTPLKLEIPIGRHTVEATSADGTLEAGQQVLVRHSGTQVRLAPLKVSVSAVPKGDGVVIPVARGDRPIIAFGELRFDLDFSTLFAFQYKNTVITNFDPSFGVMVGGGIRSKFFRASFDVRFRPVVGIHLRGALSVPLSDRIDGYLSVEVLGDFVAANFTLAVGASAGIEYLWREWFGLFAELGGRHWTDSGNDDVVLQMGVRIWFP